MGDPFYVDDVSSAKAVAGRRRPPERLGRHSRGLLFDSVVVRPSPEWLSPKASSGTSNNGVTAGVVLGPPVVVDYVLHDVERVYPELVVQCRLLNPNPAASSIRRDFR